MCLDLSINSVSDAKVILVPPQHAVDMMHSLWKRAKPSTADDQVCVPKVMKLFFYHNFSSVVKSFSTIVDNSSS